MSNILITYFSCTGTTKRVAEHLSKVTKSDLFEIAPKEAYTRKDLNWNDKNSRSSIEMNDVNIRVDIKEKVENMDKYDTILVGFPIWWYLAPNIISTFIESYDFKNKTIIPFCTSGGSGFGRSIEYLKKLAPTAIFKEGKRLSGFEKEEDIINWINQK